MAPKKLSPAPTTLTGLYGDGVSPQDLITGHQKRPLISQRERNHLGRPLSMRLRQAVIRSRSLSSGAAINSLNSRRLGFTMYTPASNAAFKAGPELSTMIFAPACFVVRAMRP